MDLASRIGAPAEDVRVTDWSGPSFDCRALSQIAPALLIAGLVRRLGEPSDAPIAIDVGGTATAGPGNRPRLVILGK